MDKTQIKVQLNSQTSNRPQELASVSNDTRESSSFPPRPGRTPHKEVGPLSEMLSRWQQTGKMKIIVPFLLATITGVLLGVCLLVLFRGQANEPTVTTVQPTATQQNANANGGQAVKTAAQVAGQALYTWQLGLFNDQATANKAQQEFASRGIHPSIRQVGTTYQLLVGVAADKAAGQALETELKKMKINYYAKPFQIADRQGYLDGLRDPNAKELTDGLAQELKLAGSVMQAANSTLPDPKTVSRLKQQLDELQAQEKNWHTSLVQAGLNGEAAQLDLTHQQLVDSISSLQTAGNLLNAQAKLTAFYIEYETLTSQLIKSNS